MSACVPYLRNKRKRWHVAEHHKHLSDRSVAPKNLVQCFRRRWCRYVSLYINTFVRKSRIRIIRLTNYFFTFSFVWGWWVAVFYCFTYFSFYRKIILFYKRTQFFSQLVNFFLGKPYAALCNISRTSGTDVSRLLPSIPLNLW